MTEIIPLNYGNLLYIAQRMRELDKEEIYATRWTNNPKDLAEDGMMIPHMSWIAAADGEPVAGFGAVPMHPGCWAVWMFATDKWPKVALSVTRYIKKKLIPSLQQAGAVRAECRSHANHHIAHKWLDSLGAVKESTLKKYGKDGEDFYLFKWHNDSTLKLEE